MSQTIPITRYRGDTFRLRITFTDADTGLPIDLTDSTLVLTVNEEEKPADSAEEIFYIDGNIVAPATDGVCDFTPSADQADNLGGYHYDIQITDSAGAVRTVLNGPFTFLQDITKTDEWFIWTPDETPADGTAVLPFSADEDWYIFNDSNMDGDFTYETRDGRRVIRDSHVRDGTFDSIGWMPKGSGFPRNIFEIPGEPLWQFMVTAYINLGLISLEIQDGVYFQGWWTMLDTRSGSVDVSSIGGTLYDPNDNRYEWVTSHTIPNTSGWPVAGWYEFGLQVNADNTVNYLIRPEGEFVIWLTVPSPYIWNGAVTPVHAPNLWTRRAYPDNPASVIDIWKYEWRRL
jgi:hypothetical protein